MCCFWIRVNKILLLLKIWYSWPVPGSTTKRCRVGWPVTTKLPGCYASSTTWFLCKLRANPPTTSYQPPATGWLNSPLRKVKLCIIIFLYSLQRSKLLVGRNCRHVSSFVRRGILADEEMKIIRLWIMQGICSNLSWPSMPTIRLAFWHWSALEKAGLLMGRLFLMFGERGKLK